MKHEHANIVDVSPLWPARLDHLRIESPQPKALAEFYERALGMAVSPLGADAYLAEGPERRLVIGRGAARGHAYSAYALVDAAQLARYRGHVVAQGAEPLPSPTPLVAEGAFAVRDPDGRLSVFGVKRAAGAAPADALPGRLQHVVVASSRFPAMMAFHRDVLGFLVSDTVHVDDGRGGLGEVNVCFLRSDEEHHSYAVFRAPQSSSDHFALDVPSWDDIRRSTISLRSTWRSGGGRGGMAPATTSSSWCATPTATTSRSPPSSSACPRARRASAGPPAARR